TDTSRPTKCAISSLLPRCSRSPDLDPFIATEGDARSASKAGPQPPRYTILRQVPPPSRERLGGSSPQADLAATTEGVQIRTHNDPFGQLRCMSEHVLF